MTRMRMIVRKKNSLDPTKDKMSWRAMNAFKEPGTIEEYCLVGW